MSREAFEAVIRAGRSTEALDADVDTRQPTVRFQADLPLPAWDDDRDDDWNDDDDDDSAVSILGATGNDHDIPGGPHEAPCEQRSPETVTFWPELKRHLDDPRLPAPEVRCMVCLEPLPVRGLPAQPPPPPQQQPQQTDFEPQAAGAPRERCCVLPCGHLIGVACLEGHLRSYGGAGPDRDDDADPSRARPPGCPVCRAGLVFRGCRDLVWGVVLPATAADEFGFDVPPLARRPEDLPRDCNRCRVRTTERLADDLVGYLLDGDGGLPGFVALQEARRFRRFVEEMSARVSRGPSWARFER